MLMELFRTEVDWTVLYFFRAENIEIWGVRGGGLSENRHLLSWKSIHRWNVPRCDHHAYASLAWEPLDVLSTTKPCLTLENYAMSSIISDFFNSNVEYQIVFYDSYVRGSFSQLLIHGWVVTRTERRSLWSLSLCTSFCSCLIGFVKYYIH